MPFTEKNKHVISVLRKDKQYSSWRLVKVFLNKSGLGGDLDHLFHVHSNCHVFECVLCVLCFYSPVRRPCYVLSRLRRLSLDLVDRVID